jgi:hypothetical protein
MAGDNWRSIILSWAGNQVTVINPESYKSTALGKGLTFQSYSATIADVGEDYIKLTFTAMKTEVKQEIEQFVPLNAVKRVSVWGGEKLVHL